MEDKMIKQKDIPGYFMVLGFNYGLLVIIYWVFDITHMSRWVMTEAVPTAGAYFWSGVFCIATSKYFASKNKPYPNLYISLGLIGFWLLLVNSQPIFDIWGIAVNVSYTTARATAGAVISLICTFVGVMINNGFCQLFTWYKRLFAFDHVEGEYKKEE